MGPSDLVKTINELRKLGPRWGPPVVVVLACAAVAWYRLQEGWGLGEVARDPLLWAVAFAGAVGVALFYHFYGLPWSLGHRQIGILVAEIPGDEHRAQQNSYVDAIRSLVSGDASLRDVLKVRLLRRQLPDDPDQQHEEALRLGRRLGASFSIRPVRTARGHSPWISIVDQPEFSREEVPLGKVSQVQLADLESLPLPRDVTLLARCALALSYYRRESYEPAVHHFTEILAASALPSAAPARPHLHLLLANSYSYVRSTDPASLLPRAIAAYDAALTEWTPRHHPTQWAGTINHGGNAYRELPGPDRSANLQEAIRCFDQALGVLTRERYPTDWAMTMNNRGAAYKELPGPDRAANLREAIRCFDQALQVYTRERYPTDWAATMNNRSAAYKELPGPDRAANLREAIRSFDEALGVRTRERYPTDWATTMNNRGNACKALPGPDRAANLREAIRCYDAALEVRTRERYPTDWAGTMNNRGNAYQELPGPDRSANLREAIRCYDQALQVRTRERYPTDWAMMMNNRGDYALDTDSW